MNNKTSQLWTLWTKPDRRLQLILVLVCAHSVGVGLGLVLQPRLILGIFGFNICTERFFPTQGGIFHIVMAVAYGMAAWNLIKYRCLILYSIIVKGMATIFLSIYFFAVQSIWSIMLFSICDCAMCLAILWAYRTWTAGISKAET